MFKKFTAFDEIPKDKQADAFELKDGTFVVFDGTGTAADIEALNKALKAERDLHTETRRTLGETKASLGEATRKLEAFDASGKQTDEKIAAMLTKWEEEKKKAVSDALAEKDKEIVPLRDRLEKYELDNVLESAFKKAGGDDVRTKRAVALAKQEGWQLVDGKAVRKDASGTILTDTPDDFFGKTFKEEFDDWYTGSRADGGAHKGGAGSGTGKGAAKDAKPTEWTTEQRESFINTNGPAAYQALLDQMLMAKPAAS